MTPVEPCKGGKLYFSAFTGKLGINSININITSLEFLCLDHFGVAMSKLNHDPSWKICKGRDSQRCWDPSEQRFWTRDDKKCPCGEREKEETQITRKKGNQKDNWDRALLPGGILR